MPTPGVTLVHHPVTPPGQDFQWPTVGPLDRADLALACPASEWMGRARPEMEPVQVPCEVQGIAGDRNTPGMG